MQKMSRFHSKTLYVTITFCRQLCGASPRWRGIGVLTWFADSSVCQIPTGFLPSRHGGTTGRILASSKRLSPIIQHTRPSAPRSNIIYLHGRLPNTAQYRGPAGELQSRGQATHSRNSSLQDFPGRKSHPGRANRKGVSLEIPRNSSFKTINTGSRSSAKVREKATNLEHKRAVFGHEGKC